MQAQNEPDLFEQAMKDFRNKAFRIKLANQFPSYIVKDLPDEEMLRFYVFGCAGENNKSQRAVAALMEKIAATSGKPPLFMLEIGDNFYKNGVSSEKDELFQTNFIDVYENQNFTFTKDTPIFLGLGNHDYKLWTWAKRFNLILGDNFDAIETYQVLFSYLLNGQFSSELFKQFTNFQLYLSKLRKYNMPSRNYTLFPNLAEIYMIDSNTLVRDWLRSKNGKKYILTKFNELYTNEEAKKYYADYLEKTADNSTEENAFDVLSMKYHKSDSELKIAAMHHPIYYTADHREYDSDAKLYLTPDDIEILTKIGIQGCYGDYIGKILEIEKMDFSLAIGAHVHGMYLYNDLKGKCQIVSGAGGAKLQHHRNFANIQNLSLFVREHGFVEVVVKRNKEMIFYFHSVENKMWVFKKDSNEPIRQFETERLTHFRQIVIGAIEKYFQYLHQEQKSSNGQFLKLFGNPSHGDKGVDRANQLRNYLNQFKVDDLKTTIKTVIEIIKDSGDKQHSLQTKVNHGIQRAYGLKLHELLLCNEFAILPLDIKKANFSSRSKNSNSFFTSKTTDDLPNTKALSLDQGDRDNYLFERKKNLL